MAMFKKDEKKKEKPKTEDLEIESPVIDAGTEAKKEDPEDLLLSNYVRFKGYFERDTITLLSEILGRFDKLEGKFDELIETIKKVSE